MKIILIIMLLMLPLQVKAEEIAGGPYLELGIYAGSLIGCSQAPRTDLSTHCYAGLITGTWATIFSKNPWIGTAIGCGLGAAKEAYDKNNGGVADFEDFGYTCGSAAVSSYAINGMIKFYNVRQTSMIGIQKRF